MSEQRFRAGQGFHFLNVDCNDFSVASSVRFFDDIWVQPPGAAPSPLHAGHAPETRTCHPAAVA